MRFGTVAFPLPMSEWDAESSASPSTSSRITSFSECVYRGAYPKHRNLRFLETLHLRTIVSLTPKPITDDPVLAEWARAQNGGAGIQVLHVRTEKPKEDTGGLTREGAARALMEVLNSENLPLYIHCLDGVDVTSTLGACLRKIQGWSEAVILAELTRGVHAWAAKSAGMQDTAPKHLAHFVERFGQPNGVLLPQRDRIPCWLWPRSSVPPLAPHDTWDARPVSVQHPTLQIYFERSESYIASQQARFGAVWSVFDHTRSRTPSSLSISDSSEIPDMPGSPDKRTVTRRFSDVTHAKPVRSLDETWAYTSVDDQDLRTPRAKPQHVDGDIPPLSDVTRGMALDMPSTSPFDDRTPLVMARDAPQRAGDVVDDDIPLLGPPVQLDESDESEPVVEDVVDDEDDEDEFEYEPMSESLEALDLEGYS